MVLLLAKTDLLEKLTNLKKKRKKKRIEKIINQQLIVGSSLN
jgi:hypothetical protein